MRITEELRAQASVENYKRTFWDNLPRLLDRVVNRLAFFATAKINSVNGLGAISSSL